MRYFVGIKSLSNWVVFLWVVFIIFVTADPLKIFNGVNKKHINPVEIKQQESFQEIMETLNQIKSDIEILKNKK